MISLKELLNGKAEFKNVPKTTQDNLMTLLERINRVRQAYKKPMYVTSGLRLPAGNKAVGGAAQSKHLIGAAVDIADVDGSLWAWCIKNIGLLTDVGLWLEDKRWTPTWTHFQVIAPKSGKRIFVPDTSKPKAPQAWDGKYNARYDGF